MNPIASNIRALRLKHQMTQAQLATALGVQYQTVSKWETGVTLPDTMMIPKLADLFQVSTDVLYGRSFTACQREMPADSTQFLLRTYARMYDPEAGPWNLSVENKYLEYRLSDFFSKHFPVPEKARLCNIGIGAGEWDRYLSYQLNGGSLTSIDREPVCCRQLEQRLLLEGNPNAVAVICADAAELALGEEFDIVTLVGSTLRESGMGTDLLEKAMGFVAKGGGLYFQTLENVDSDRVIRLAHRNGLKLDAFLEEEAYGFCCRYYKFIRK